MLLATQAFLYNAVIFTFSIVLTTFFEVDSSVAGLYLVPFGIANFLGALTLGRTVRHRRAPADDLRVPTSWRRRSSPSLAALLHAGSLTTWGFVGLLCVTFFFAVAPRPSAGYLTVSETFPLETRAMAIALFYAISTGIGGGVGPLLFGKLLGGDDPTAVALGYLIAAGLMALAAITEVAFGVNAEQESLEDIAPPLAAEEAAASSCPRFEISMAVCGCLLAPGGPRQARTYVEYAPRRRRPPGTTMHPAACGPNFRIGTLDAGDRRQRAAAQHVVAQLSGALGRPAARRREVLDQSLDVGDRGALGVLEAGTEDEGVRGVAKALLLVGQQLRGADLVDRANDAGVGLGALGGHGRSSFRHGHRPAPVRTPDPEPMIRRCLSDPAQRMRRCVHLRRSRAVSDPADLGVLEAAARAARA